MRVPRIRPVLEEQGIRPPAHESERHLDKKLTRQSQSKPFSTYKEAQEMIEQQVVENLQKSHDFDTLMDRDKKYSMSPPKRHKKNKNPLMNSQRDMSGVSMDFERESPKRRKDRNPLMNSQR